MKMWMMQNRNQFYEPKISVYGRKSYRTANEDGIDARAVNGLECWIAVSYTHLDVYKRQP